MRTITLLLSVVILGSAPAASSSAPAPPWSWPTSGTHVVERPFIAPASDYGAGHRGIDLAAGGELLAPTDGIVSYAGAVVDRGVLSIDHGGGVVSSYEPVETTLRAGDIVHRGDRIGTIDAGHCDTLCVHMGVRVNGQYVSPLRYLGGLPRAVLLPTRPIAH